MARALRIEVAGGRYHVMSRGNERREIFADDRDRLHFLQLLGELSERFGARVHAFVLMGNHYHALIETPEGNLSRVMQWLNLSYTVWYNRRHRRSGHLFQGRYAAIIIEDEVGFAEVGRYVHLNPVRTKRFGLDKRKRQAGKIALAPPSSRKDVVERIKELRNYRWSSYGAYAGYRCAPKWLCQETLSGVCGGRTVKERQRAMRDYTEEAVREGMEQSPWERLVGGVVLGSRSFAQGLSRRIKGARRERRAMKHLGQPPTWKSIVKVVEEAKGESWNSFRDRYGDWGRDAAIWLGRREGRLKLSQLGELAGGVDYAAVGAGIGRFQRRLIRDAKLTRIMQQCRIQLSNV